MLTSQTGLHTWPLADRLQVKCQQNKRLYKNICQILIMINHGEAEAIITYEVTTRAAA